ncbi:DUF6302 family protein [Streptomyces sp. NPDC047082]|uniref:DUF6302 family protein n=1 Tax=Streptomyces sp. NPDC047082 TaxID=3155259 RepID=UPI00340DEC36
MSLSSLGRLNSRNCLAGSSAIEGDEDELVRQPSPVPQTLEVRLLSPQEAHDYKHWATRLEDPELLRAAVAVALYRVPLLAVPVRAGRRGGRLHMLPGRCPSASEQLPGRPRPRAAVQVSTRTHPRAPGARDPTKPLQAAAGRAFDSWDGWAATSAGSQPSPTAARPSACGCSPLARSDILPQPSRLPKRLPGGRRLPPQGLCPCHPAVFQPPHEAPMPLLTPSRRAPALPVVALRRTGGCLGGHQ